MKSYLLLPHIKIQNANAISSSITIGIPAMTAWMGFMHAVERKLKAIETLKGISFEGLALSIHSHNLHSYNLKGNQHKSIATSANPSVIKGNKVERPPFIAEGRIDLDVSLLIEALNINGDNSQEICQLVDNMLHRMKIAGGDIIEYQSADIYIEETEASSKQLIRRLMPGYVLIARNDVLSDIKPGEDDIDRLFKCISVTCTSEKNDNGEVVAWNYSREYPGWLVPVAVGYRGITPLGMVAGQRDNRYMHQFVEPLVTIGEFKPAYRIHSIDDIIWRYESGENLYLCVNKNVLN